MNITLDGKKIALDPRNALGKGGEADVYTLGNGSALKIYKTPDHPDFEHFPDQQLEAARRLDLIQNKLPKFPRGIHPRVVEPEKLALDAKSRRIAGYSMRLVQNAEPLYRYGERAFRGAAGIRNAAVVAIFRELRDTVGSLHRAGVVIGDFNDLNVLVQNVTPYMIDADSFQFGPFLCPMYTVKFVDPLLCDQTAATLSLQQPHNPNSDWYAFAIMLLQALLFVHPYGGIYKPKDAAKRIVHDARPMQRITIFDPEVVYPKPALPYKHLSDDALDYFYRVFVKDERGEIAQGVLDAMEWTVCPTCGAEHARKHCPNCTHTAPAAIKSVTRVRGTVTATRVFRTEGAIVYVTLENGRPRWVYHEADAYKREDGSVIIRGALDGRLRFRIMNTTTLIGRDNQFATMYFSGDRVEHKRCDAFALTPMFDVSGRTRFWLDNGQLLRDGPLGQEYIGDVLTGQTLFWAGPRFGFGLYRAGRLSVAFVFDVKQRGINDRVKLPPIRGQLLDAACSFSDEHCWFFYVEHDGRRTIHHCVVLAPDGSVVAQAEGEQGDGGWLGQLHGHCAAGHALFAPTDEGVVRLSVNAGKFAIDRQFPDTEPFVDASSRLYVTSEGIFVASRHEISLLKLN